MKRLLTLTLICFGVLSLAISAVLIIEHRQHPVEPLAELHQCEREMCLFDIVPSKTTLTDAHMALKQTGLFTVADFSADTAFKRSDPFYRVDLEGEVGACSSTPDCVAQIDLVFTHTQNSLTAGQVVSEFGPPCGIVPEFIRGRTVLIYPGMVLFFMSDVPSTGQRFQPILLLGQIDIFKNDESCEQLAAQTSDYFPWHGFTIYSKNTVK